MITDNPIDRIAELRDQLYAIKLWLLYCLDSKGESRHSVDSNGHINNTWGVVPIPDWDVKQKINDITETMEVTR